MGKKKYIILILLICLCIYLFIPKEERLILTETQKQDMDRYYTQDETRQDLFGILEIPSLNIKNPIYKKGMKENNVDENIQLLEENISNNLKSNFIVLAGHSGNGTHAYFKNLYQLQEKEAIFFSYQNQKKEYQFFKKEEVPKTGVVYIENYDFPYLVLITCSKTKEDIQEVYYAKFIKNMT